jgi:hypothetical protein
MYTCDVDLGPMLDDHTGRIDACGGGRLSHFQHAPHLKLFPFMMVVQANLRLQDHCTLPHNRK